MENVLLMTHFFLFVQNKPYTYHPVEVGLRYIESDAYAEVYGDEPVWTNYRRNFKGQFAPRRTRPHCIVSCIISIAADNSKEFQSVNPGAQRFCFAVGCVGLAC